MTAPAPRGEEPVAWLRRQSDNAYVRYTDLLRHERCLGAEAKIKAGTFTVEQLAAHTKAAELLGAHRAYADAAKFAAHPPADNVRDQGEGLAAIARIIESVDQRAMACDGPVLPTLKVMTQAEISEIYRIAKGGAT